VYPYALATSSFLALLAGDIQGAGAHAVADDQGRAVQVGSINTRVESAPVSILALKVRLVSALETKM